MPSGRDGIGEGTAHGIGNNSGGSGSANDNQNAYENAAGNPGYTNWSYGNDGDGGGSNITIVHPWSPSPPPEDPSQTFETVIVEGGSNQLDDSGRGLFA